MTIATTILLAKMLGLYLVIVSLLMLLKPEHMKRQVELFVSNESVFFMMAIMTLILGIIMVVFHNVWVFAWPVVVTILCWMTFIKGVLRLFAPEFVVKKAQAVMKPKAYYSISYATLLVGIFLLIKGFMPV